MSNNNKKAAAEASAAAIAKFLANGGSVTVGKPQATPTNTAFVTAAEERRAAAKTARIQAAREERALLEGRTLTARTAVVKLKDVEKDAAKHSLPAWSEENECERVVEATLRAIANGASPEEAHGIGEDVRAAYQRSTHRANE